MLTYPNCQKLWSVLRTILIAWDVCAKMSGASYVSSAPYLLRIFWLLYVLKILVCSRWPVCQGLWLHLRVLGIIHARKNWRVICTLRATKFDLSYTLNNQIVKISREKNNIKYHELRAFLSWNILVSKKKFSFEFTKEKKQKSNIKIMSDFKISVYELQVCELKAK